MFTIELSGGESVAKGLGALILAAQNLTPFWKDVFAPRYYAQVQALFATGGRGRSQATGQFTGGAWAALSPTYRAWKDQHFPGRPLLVRTGVLRDSLTWYAGAPGVGGIFQAQPHQVLVGTTVPYGRYHQTGTASMPARPFLPPPDVNVFGPLLEAWLVKAFKMQTASPGPIQAGPGGVGL